MLGAWCFAISDHALHGVLGVLQGAILHRPPLLRDSTGDVGLDESLKGRKIDRSLGIPCLPEPPYFPDDAKSLRDDFLRVTDTHRPQPRWRIVDDIDGPSDGGPPELQVWNPAPPLVLFGPTAIPPQDASQLLHPPFEFPELPIKCNPESIHHALVQIGVHLSQMPPKDAGLPESYALCASIMRPRRLGTL